MIFQLLKKKLLIATDSFLPRWDGVARFLSELIPDLKKDFIITVIAPKFKGKIPKIPGVKIIRMPLRNIQVGDYYPAKLDKKKIQKAVEDSDVVFSQTLGPIGAYSIIYGKRKKKKIISYIHSVEWELFSESVAELKVNKWLVKNFTKVFARRLYNIAKSTGPWKAMNCFSYATEEHPIRLSV